MIPVSQTCRAARSLVVMSRQGTQVGGKGAQRLRVDAKRFDIADQQGLADLAVALAQIGALVMATVFSLPDLPPSTSPAFSSLRTA